MYISELFTVVGYLHTAGFKNRWGINFAKCIFTHTNTNIYITKPPDWVGKILFDEPKMLLLALQRDLSISTDTSLYHHTSDQGIEPMDIALD